MRLPILAAATGLFAALSAAAVAQAAPLHTYTIYDLPKSTAGCAADAAALGQRVHDLTGVEIFRTQCGTIWDDSYEVTVTYVRDQPLPQVSTLDPNAYNQSAYATPAACEADRVRQGDLFRAATGLEPLVVYCFGSSSSLVVRALGTPREWPRFFSQTIYDAPIGDIAALSAQIAQRAEQLGVPLFKAAIAPGMMESYLSLGYYGAEDRRFGLYDNLAYGSVEECQGAIATVEGFFQGGGETTLASFCGKVDLMNEYRLYVVSYANTGVLSRENAGIDYEAPAACQGDLERVIALYRQQHGAAVLGGLCAYDDGRGSYGVTIFSRTEG